MKKVLYFASVLIGFSLISIAQRAPEQAAALTGTVTSPEEGKMEGVLVSAKRGDEQDHNRGKQCPGAVQLSAQ